MVDFIDLIIEFLFVFEVVASELLEAGVAGGLASEAGTFNTNSLRPIIQLFITLVVDPVKIMMILLAHILVSLISIFSQHVLEHGVSALQLLWKNMNHGKTTRFPPQNYMTVLTYFLKGGFPSIS